jgi:hypothetical protein
MTTMAEGRAALRRLRAGLLESEQGSRNEAQTRLDIINKLIVECFGWNGERRTKVQVEVHERGEFSDYELGIPRCAIWEAKRESVGFELPPGTSRRPVQDIASVIQRTPETREALEQAQRYCSSRGVELAVATNGHQLVGFLATRTDGVAPLDGHCLAIESLERLDEEFPLAWDLLSPDGVAEKRYVRILKLGNERNIPPKLSSFLGQYPRHRYLSDLQSNLRTLSELLLQDIGDTEAEEDQFIRRCYCSSGALSQHALLNKKILEARYSALTESAGLNSVMEPMNPKEGRGAIPPSVLQEAFSRRPVILIGDVGVGKTSFLKHFIYEDAKDVFTNAIYIYVNLGERGTLDPNVRALILRATEDQLYKRYSIDIRERKFLHGVYASEMERFKKGAYSELFASDPTKAEERMADMLHGLTRDAFEHLRRSVMHLTKGRHHQVIFILDNADQRPDDVQQEAFVIAQELARDWICHVFISLRPGTFYRSRVSGVLAAYPHRVFTIAPPRTDEFLEKRLTYALDMAEGRLPLERLQGIQLNIGSIASVIRALLQSLQQSDELQELLANVTGGNVRELLQFVTSFIGSPNVDAEKIVSIMTRQRFYRVPLHELSKAALLGDYAHYHAESSLAMNVFDVRRADPREHFLVLLLLSFLDFDGSHREADGFVDAAILQEEIQRHAFTIKQSADAVERMTDRRLIETPHRATFTDDGQLKLVPPREKYRLTARGAYHLFKWMPTFAYIDAMVFDTPIFDERTRDVVSTDLESFDIRARFSRATGFRAYLLAQWRDAGIKATYFDFETLLRRGEGTFQAVQQVGRGPRPERESTGGPFSR